MINGIHLKGGRDLLITMSAITDRGPTPITKTIK